MQQVMLVNNSYVKLDFFLGTKLIFDVFIQYNIYNFTSL